MKQLNGPSDVVNEYSNYLSSIDPDSKNGAVIVGGHFPLTNELTTIQTKSKPLDEGNKTLYENLDAWGAFSRHTFELSCEIARKLIDEQRRNVKIVLLADDINISGKTWSDSRIELNKSKLKKLRKLFFEKYSSDEFMLPGDYKDITEKYGLGNEHFLRHNQPERNIENSVIFSEKKLEAYEDILIENLCSKAVAGLYTHQLPKNKKTHVLGLYPQRCEKGLCDNLLLEIPELNNLASSAHVFFPGARGMSVEQMYSGKTIKMII